MTQKIEHIAPVPGDNMLNVYSEMVEKFNKMIDIFNNNMATIQKNNEKTEDHLVG